MEEGECYNLLSFLRLIEGIKDVLRDPSIEELILRGANFDREFLLINLFTNRFPALLDLS